MPKHPFFSVVIPTYNRQEMVVDAVQSVLAQSFTDYEIIVVDDGSKDDTERVLSAYLDRIKYVRQTNAGVATARNRGVVESCGEYVCYLDSDDTWPPNKLEVYKEAIDAHDSVPFVFSDFRKYNMKSDERYEKSNSDMFPYIFELSQPTHYGAYNLAGDNKLELLLTGYPLYPSTFAVKRDVHDNFRWDPGILKSEDFNFVLRLSKNYDMLYVDKDLATVRVHDSNKSADFLLKDKTNLATMRLYRDLYAKGRTKSICNYYISRRQFLDGKGYINKGLVGQGMFLIATSLAYKENWGRLMLKVWSRLGGR